MEGVARAATLADEVHLAKIFEPTQHENWKNLKKNKKKVFFNFNLTRSGLDRIGFIRALVFVFFHRLPRFVTSCTVVASVWPHI